MVRIQLHLICIWLVTCVSMFVIMDLNHFWLFAFERFNGILGQLPNNNRSIEVQMMKQFQQVMSLSLPNEFRQKFEGLLNFGRQEHGTLACDFSETNAHENIAAFSVASPTHSILLPSSYIRSVFSSTDMEIVHKMYAKLYSIPLNTDLEIQIRAATCLSNTTAERGL